MKKLILAVAAVTATFAVNAASVNWMSGAMVLPTSATDGTLSTTKITSSSGYTVSMYAFESLASFTFDEGDLYNWYTTDTSAAFKGMTAIAGTVNMGTSATTVTAKGTLVPGTEGDPVYAAVLFVLTDTDSGKDVWYMENYGSAATAKATKSLSNLALKVGGGTSTTATSWTAASVPEPTSGLLLLLGMAGLALKRKRA